MSERNTNKDAMIKLIYGEKSLIEVFGTTEVDEMFLYNYCRQLYISWSMNEIKIPNTQENLKLVLREKRKYGSLEMGFVLDSEYITLRAKNKQDLTYLQLKYKF